MADYELVKIDENIISTGCFVDNHITRVLCCRNIRKPSTDPEAYLDPLEKVAGLPVKKVFPTHHSLDIKPEILIRMREAFRNLKADGKLHHGSGTFDYGDWGVWL